MYHYREAYSSDIPKSMTSVAWASWFKSMHSIRRRAATSRARRASRKRSRPRARDPPHLTVVLVQPGVHGVHDVRTNRGQENFRQGARRAVAALDGDHGKRGRHGVGRARRGKAERETRRGLSGRCVGFPQYMGFGFTVYDNLGVYGMIQTLMYAHYVLQCAL